MSTCKTCSRRDVDCPVDPIDMTGGCVEHHKGPEQLQLLGPEQVQLLGLAADAPGSGKDTLFSLLKADEPRLVNLKFADALTEDFVRMFKDQAAFDEDDLRRIRNDPELKDRKWNTLKLKNIHPDFDKYVSFCVSNLGMDIEAPMSAREHLDIYGTKFKREFEGNDNIWLDLGIAAAKRVYQDGNIPVFTDVRFPNEAANVQQIGGKLIHIAADWAIQKAADKITGIAEGHLKGWDFDLQINNVFKDPDNMKVQFYANYKF